MDTSTTAHLHVVEDFSHVGWTCYLDPCPHRPEDTLTAEEFAAVLVRAEKANLVGIAHEVAWYDGPIMGFAITDEVYDLLPDNIRDPRFNP